MNLVGANHLFLLDMHWNPQLESQACDRVYRLVIGFSLAGNKTDMNSQPNRKLQARNESH